MGSAKDKFDKAVSDLELGKPILLFDFEERENETDLIYYGPYINSKAVYDLRIHAGAPLSVYIDHETASKIGITIFSEMIRDLDKRKYPIMHSLVRPVGGTDPRFSLTFDFRGNITGCSYFETARTIQKLSEMIVADNCQNFSSEFRSPGHIPLIISSPNLIKDRNGHSELIMTIIKKAGLAPIVAASEILDMYSGNSLNYEQAKAYADLNNLVFLTGEDVMKLN